MSEILADCISLPIRDGAIVAVGKRPSDRDVQVIWIRDCVEGDRPDIPDFDAVNPQGQFIKNNQVHTAVRLSDEALKATSDLIVEYLRRQGSSAWRKSCAVLLDVNEPSRLDGDVDV